MPYIKKKNKDKFEPEFENLKKKIEGLEKGELTYLLYAIALKDIKSKGRSYTNISSAISCLIDAAEELRRRHLNPYEDEKIREDGDVD